MNAFILWLAQGFGIGRIPVAPGTFGSVLGLLWFGLLLWPGNLWFFVGGTFFGLAASIRLCEAGEEILGRKDPGSVVFDEIAAIPVCFLGWMIIELVQAGSLPDPQYFLGKRVWPLTLGVFVLFRIFDVWKPWPVRQSQSLPGGWGVTVDDLLAAVYVNLVVLATYFGRTWLAP
ncbi:MAG TPA: phosphatidylglycerophosphatase A [Candidatus Paceibacterota bacterium]|nr:phosphatidylglycerophosphatase A [Candidatus Paceibacterota bacterium]